MNKSTAKDPTKLFPRAPTPQQQAEAASFDKPIAKDLKELGYGG